MGYLRTCQILIAVLPEIFVLSAACLILMMDVYVTEGYRFVLYAKLDLQLM